MMSLLLGIPILQPKVRLCRVDKLIYGCHGGRNVLANNLSDTTAKDVLYLGNEVPCGAREEVPGSEEPSDRCMKDAPRHKERPAVF